jgi:hypothetical protein
MSRGRGRESDSTMSEPYISEGEELARRVAKVMGESSAAAAAIADLEQRRADGISHAWIEWDGRTWWVRGSPTNSGADRG